MLNTLRPDPSAPGCPICHGPAHLRETDGLDLSNGLTNMKKCKEYAFECPKGCTIAKDGYGGVIYRTKKEASRDWGELCNRGYRATLKQEMLEWIKRKRR